MKAKPVRSAIGRRQSLVPSPFARGDRELPLPKSFNGAILVPKVPESGECRLRGGDNGIGDFARFCRNCIASWRIAAYEGDTPRAAHSQGLDHL